MRGVEYACGAYNLVIQVRTLKATKTNKKVSKNFNLKQFIKNITTCLFGGDMKLMSPSIQNIMGFPILFENPV